jgi:hypothetical protein
MRFRGMITAATVLLVAGSIGTAVRAKDDDKGNPNAAAVMDAVVDFGQPQPQGTPAAATHFLQPVGGQPDGTTTIFRGGTVTFRVNGGGHGVSVYPVTRETTREDILAAVCPTRSGCAADFLNAPHTIKDSDGNVLLDIGPNPPIARVDDPDHIMMGAAALIPTGVDANGNPTFAAGIFHQGTTAPGVTPARPIAEQIRVAFPKKGRYLAICMNRAHSFNDWMFAFIDVVGSDGDDQQ